MKGSFNVKKQKIVAVLTAVSMFGAVNTPLISNVRAESDFENSLSEPETPIAVNSEVELFTDGMENLDFVYGGTKSSFQEFDAENYSVRCWGDGQRIRPNANDGTQDKHLIFQAPGGNDIFEAAIWMYFYNEDSKDKMKISVSKDGITYKNADVEKTVPDMYYIPQEANSKFLSSYFGCVYHLNNLDEGIKYIKIQWNNWKYNNGGSSEGILGKVQINYTIEEKLPIEIKGSLVTDLLNDNTKVYSSDGIAFEKGNIFEYNFDSSRAVAEKDGANLVYKAKDGSTISDVVIKTYYPNGKTEDFSVLVSEDGVNYSDAQVMSTQNGNEVIYYKSALKTNSKYLKIVFPSSDEAKLGKVMLGNENSRLRVDYVTYNEETKTAVSYVTNRSNAPIKATLVLAGYDSNGNMLKIVTDSKMLEAGLSDTFNADISSYNGNFSTVDAYVINTLDNPTPADGFSINPTGSITLDKPKAVANKITITGKLTSDYANSEVCAVVAKKSETESTVNADDVIYARRVNVNSDGSYVFNFDIDSSIPTSYFKAIVSGSGVSAAKSEEFIYASAQDRSKIIEIINNAPSAEYIKNFLDGTIAELNYTVALRAMDMDMSAYSGMSDSARLAIAVSVYNMKNKTAFTDETIDENIDRAIYVEKVNKASGADEIKTLVNSKLSYFGLTDTESKFTKAFDNMNIGVQESFYSQLLNMKAASPDEMVKNINDAIIIAYFNNALYNDVEGLIAEYKSELVSAGGADEVEKYSSLNDYDKSKANKEIVGKKYTSLEAIVKAIGDASGANRGGNGGSNNRGGSSGGGKTSTITSNNTVNNDMPSFSDLTGSEWAKESIEYLTKAGIVSGYGDGTFKPNTNITREEFVKMLVSAFELKNNTAASDFSDVKSDNWSYVYVSSAYAYGIVNGLDDGRFGFGRNITRQDMAVMAYNTLIKKGAVLAVSTEPFADDGEISDYAKEAVNKLNASKVINGIGNNSFAPAQFTTRAQAAKVIYELIKLIEN